MSNKGNAQGEIITFYSFKGGVGRSMALANVAFIAAKNGLKVLVMDWDLEAPGLLYYFRGLLDPVAAKNVIRTPGVLNMLWEWSFRVTSITNNEQTENLLSELAGGGIFHKCISTVGDEDFTAPGSIDFMSAGSAQVETPDSLPYEDALAKFSWPTFYENAFGGVLIDGLRKWAKSNYDLVLVDSRTGLADVAGLCTMQLPDTAALCFILNRQNIDGVAKVSGAIRSQRAEKVRVRAIPMRVARQETPEESDARARAIYQLTTIGGFSSEAIQDDLKKLAVPTDSGIPFYEVLAPFAPSAASNPARDPLTLNYVQLTSELLGQEFSPPAISESQAELVKARLQPRQATIDYIKKLVTAEPGRAVAELQKLLISAQEAVLEGSMPDADYVMALADAAISLDDTRTEKAAIGLKGQAADLMRDLYSRDQETWRAPLINTLEKLINEYSLMDQEEAELSLLEEIDVLLANIQTNASKLQRLHYRRRAAWAYYYADNEEASLQTIGEINALLNEFRRDKTRLSPEQLEQLMAAEMDTHLARAALYDMNFQPERSVEEIKKSIDKSEEFSTLSSSREILRLTTQGHRTIAGIYHQTGNPDDAARHAVRALQTSPLDSYWQFKEFASYIRDSSSPDAYGASLLKALFSNEKYPIEQLLGNFFGRSPGAAMDFLEACTLLAENLDVADSDTLEALKRLAAAVEASLKTILRRRHTVGAKMGANFDQALTRLEQAINSAGAQWAAPKDFKA